MFEFLLYIIVASVYAAVGFYFFHVTIALLVLVGICYGLMEVATSQEKKTYLMKKIRVLFQMLAFWIILSSIVYIWIYTAGR